MEFGKKLQELRKSKGLTQEELAESLYVSRTAVSKWESGRGCPSIDSLKEISKYFGVSIDDLLSGEKLISLAEQENQANVRKLCHALHGMLDVLSLLLILLPIYPQEVEGYVYGVNLWRYAQAAEYIRRAYWGLFSAQAFIGVVEMVQARREDGAWRKTMPEISLLLSVASVLCLVLARETYAAVLAILLMLFKMALVFRSVKRTR